MVDGAENIRTVNRRLGWDLPTEGARTINGLLLEHLEHIPGPGTSVRIGDLALTITEMSDNLIKAVQIQPLADLDDGTDDDSG